MMRTTAHTNNGRANHGRHTRHPVREQTKGEQRSLMTHGVETDITLRENAECGICHKLFAPASIIIEDAYLHVESGGGAVLDCAVFCDHCNVITRYTIRVDQNMRSQELLKVAKTADQRKIDEFLQLYPQARGIVE